MKRLNERRNSSCFVNYFVLNYCFLLSFLSLLVVFFLFYFFFYLFIFYFSLYLNSVNKTDIFAVVLLLKQNTKWSNTHKLAWTFLIVFILFQGESFQKSIYYSPSSHDNKNCHQLSSHCHISDAWRYLVHRCTLSHYFQDLFRNWDWHTCRSGSTKAHNHQSSWLFLFQ